MVTSDLIIIEVLNALSTHPHGVKRHAAEYFERVKDLTGFTIIRCSSILFEQAIRLYLQASDKSWSLTDCASFIIMRERNITEALTFDHHYEQAGFKALLRIE